MIDLPWISHCTTRSAYWLNELLSVRDQSDGTNNHARLPRTGKRSPPVSTYSFLIHIGLHLLHDDKQRLLF